MIGYQRVHGMQLLGGLFFILATYGAQAQRVQWASELISFSSEYSRKESSAVQVLGKPDVWPGFGPSDVAWAMSRPSSAFDEFVRVGFQEPMSIQQVAIAESLNPGAIYRIIVYDLADNKHILYEQKSETVAQFYNGSRLFTVVLDQPTPYAVKELKLVLRTSRVDGMSQIDAIAISDSKQEIRPEFKTIDDDLFDEPAENLGPNVNSEYPDMLPMISPDGRTLYFARKVHPGNTGVELRDDIWVSHMDAAGHWSPAVNVGTPLNNEHHNFVSWISPDGRQLLLPHDYQRREYGTEFRISRSEFHGNQWTEPVVLRIPDLYNLSTFTCIHMDADGQTLLMALEREDGMGGLDLYVSRYSPSFGWSPPQSLGPTVNTAGMEGSVFLAADGLSLYFASNGLPGYGGYDMFLSRRLDDSWTSWSEPINLGSRINSQRDEYYYTIPASGEFAYFSSEQGGFGEADLYRIRLPRSAQPDPVTLLEARVINQKTNQLIPARLTFQKQEQSSDPSEGSNSFIGRRDTARAVVLAQADGFFPSGIDLNAIPPKPILWMDQPLSPDASQDYPSALDTPVHDEAEESATAFLETPVMDEPEEPIIASELPYVEIRQDIRLVPLEVGNLVRLNGVYFPANQSFLLRQSRVELDIVAEFLRTHPAVAVEVGGHTNGLPPEGYCQELSEARAKAVVAYLIENGVDREQLSAHGYGKSSPVADNATLEGRKLNQRVELKILAIGD
jgi:OmpA-OmpF porin, OOP family